MSPTIGGLVVGLSAFSHTHMSDDVQRSLGRIEGKIDSLLTSKKDHETRLRALERWRWLILGGCTVIGVLFKFVHV